LFSPVKNIPMKKMKSSLIYGGIEAGGTKFVCAIGTGPDNIVSKTQTPTTTPEETLRKAISFFKNAMQKMPLAAIGIASFGPLDINQQSPTYGYITNTPKSDWANTNLAKNIHDALGIPVALDTDVNGADLGEQYWGAAKGLDTFIYITVGTGIGGGGIINGKMLHGLVHPEMGHILVPHDLQKDPFPGSCLYHKDCLEGLASGEAMAKRWGKSPEELPPGHPGWELEAEYLACGIMNYICTLSPQKIIIGGGIMKAPGLLAAVRKRVMELLNSYVNSPAITKHIDGYIVPPALGDMAGVLGAIALAQQDMGMR
jgi:fructokinase